MINKKQIDFLDKCVIVFGISAVILILILAIIEVLK